MIRAQGFEGGHPETVTTDEREEASVPPRWRHDPLEPDDSDDEVVVTTTRRILRLAISAADVGTRFAREDRTIDPAAWLMAPRRLFDGRTALDACQELTGFHRSIVLHGLRLPLDVTAEDVDDLLAADPSSGHDAGATTTGSPPDPDVGRPQPRLFSCWVDTSDAKGRLFAFCAVVTERPADLVERVVGRYGPAAAAEARYSTGFDHTTPLATAMISDAMADTLALAAGDPTSPLATGLDVVVEQRFLA